MRIIHFDASDTHQKFFFPPLFCAYLFFFSKLFNLIQSSVNPHYSFTDNPNIQFNERMNFFPFFFLLCLLFVPSFAYFVNHHSCVNGNKKTEQSHKNTMVRLLLMTTFIIFKCLPKCVLAWVSFFFIFFFVMTTEKPFYKWCTHVLLLLRTKQQKNWSQRQRDDSWTESDMTSCYETTKKPFFSAC